MKLLSRCLLLVFTVALLFSLFSCGDRVTFDAYALLGESYESADGCVYSYPSMTAGIQYSEPGVAYRKCYAPMGQMVDGERTLMLMLVRYEYDGPNEAIKQFVEEKNAEILAYAEEHNEYETVLNVKFEDHDDYILMDGVRYDKK